MERLLIHVGRVGHAVTEVSSRKYLWSCNLDQVLEERPEKGSNRAEIHVSGRIEGGIECLRFRV